MASTFQVGAGEITQIVVTDGTSTATIPAEMIEGYSLSTEKDSFDAAIGHSVDRGSMTKTLAFNAFKVDQFDELNAIMVAKADTQATVTYIGGNTQILNEGRIRVTPILHSVSDVERVYVAAGSATNDDILNGESSGVWTDVGVTLDVPTLSFSFPFDGTDGNGRPYFSSCAFELEFMLPADYYSTFTEGETKRVAFALPHSGFEVFTGRVYKNFADEDASMPRAIRIVLRGVNSNWGDLITFTDGAGTGSSNEQIDGTADALSIPENYLHGFAVEFVASGYDEADVSSLVTE